MSATIRHSVLALLATVAFASGAFSQDTVLSELYGRGVHAYFAGNMSEAQQHLSMAIDQGLQDPRAYYFRGLTYTRQGQAEAARDDFRTGATLEAEGTSAIYPVSKSLQRIQGRVRLTIEEERRVARLAVRQKENAARKVRYDNFNQAQSGVTRNNDTLEPVEGELPPPAVDDPTNPFGNADPGAAPPAAPMNTTPPPAEPMEDSPFGAPPPADNSNPFGAPPADNSNPFGAPPAENSPPAAPADNNNPFGAPPPAEPADNGNPFGAPPPADPADNGNPFGAPPPADPADPADNGNPFGAPPPADPAGAGNPFGAAPPAEPAPAAGGESGGGIFGSLIRAVGKAIPDSDAPGAGGGPMPNDQGNPFGDDPNQPPPGNVPPSPFGGPPPGQPGEDAAPPGNPFGAPPADNTPPPPAADPDNPFGI